MLGCCCSCHPGFSWKSCQFWITCLFWVNATCTLQVLSGKWLSLTWLHNLIPTYLSKHRFYCNPSRLIVCDFLDVSIFLYFLVMLFLLWKCLCSLSFEFSPVFTGQLKFHFILVLSLDHTKLNTALQSYLHLYNTERSENGKLLNNFISNNKF